MAKPLDFNKALSRFKHLPRMDDVWQAAIVALPTWVDDQPGRDPYRPIAVVCLSTTRPAARFTLVGMHEPDAPGAAAATLNALAELAADKKTGYRPSVVQVSDPRVVTALAAALEGTGTIVEQAGKLPALHTFLHLMAAEAFGDDVASALDAPGVTPERLRGFAGAAKAFYEAAPWRHLDDGDLVRVEAPKAQKGLSLFCVMGAAGQEFGLSFFGSERQYQAIFDAPEPETLFGGGAWGVWLNRGWDTPPSDVLVWDEHQLPLASIRAYPLAARLQSGREPQRADARQLAYFEGLLRALAATTEEEMDSGRWSRTVETVDGPAVYTLALPNLLEEADEPRPLHGAQARRSMERTSAEISRALSQMSFDNLDDFNETLRSKFTGVKLDDIPSTASTPLEQAQDLIYEAMEASGRRQVQLIRRALELSPDCADAYVLLAERSTARDEQQSVLRTGRGRRRARPRPGGLRQPGSVVLGRRVDASVHARPLRARRCPGRARRHGRGHRSFPGAAAVEPGRQPGRALSAAVGAARRQSPRRGGRAAGRTRRGQRLVELCRDPGCAEEGRPPARADSTSRGAPCQPPCAEVPDGAARPACLAARGVRMGQPRGSDTVRRGPHRRLGVNAGGDCLVESGNQEPQMSGWTDRPGRDP